MTTGDASFRVVPEEVRAIGRFAGGVAEQLRAASSALDRDVQGLFDTWKGAAADAYGVGWKEMSDGASKAWDSLADLASKLDSSAATFQAQDESNASLLSSIRID